MKIDLKALARVSKVLAIVDCVVVPLVLRPRWGVSRIDDAQLVALAILSLIPNRWVAGTRFLFGTALLLSLLPVRVFLHTSVFKDLDLASAIGAGIVVPLVFVPLPLSFVLSRMRFLRKDRFVFA
jgi:hypothetical protein